MACWLLLAGSASAAFTPTAAQSKSETASSGSTSATLTWTEDADTFQKSGTTLSVTRGGSTLLTTSVASGDCTIDYCGPTSVVLNEDAALRVQDLNGDGEPEVLVPMFSGGAHCCLFLFIWRFENGAYTGTVAEQGNAWVNLKDLNKDGIPELETSDDRFSYLYTSYAGSSRPIMILGYSSSEANGFVDRTSSFRSLIKADSKRQLKALKELCRDKTAETAGLAAAWAADEYRLGNRKKTMKRLRGLADRGCLHKSSSAPGGRKFVRVLDKFLRSMREYR